jgi:Arc/MetJ-type ribon-helix-helix transcriptional regulator
MNVELTADQKDFARRAIEAGRAQREEDVVEEALSMWEERERKRVELIAMIEEARASYAAGRYRAITDESPEELAKEVGERGRARLAAMEMVKSS